MTVTEVYDSYVLTEQLFNIFYPEPDDYFCSYYNQDQGVLVFLVSGFHKYDCEDVLKLEEIKPFTWLVSDSLNNDFELRFSVFLK